MANFESIFFATADTGAAKDQFTAQQVRGPFRPSPESLVGASDTAKAVTNQGIFARDIRALLNQDAIADAMPKVSSGRSPAA